VTALSSEQLAQGACADLLPEVVDKYLFSNANTEAFQAMTAKAICGNCAVHAMCLVDAIMAPEQPRGVRGGESDHSVQALRKEYRHGAEVAELVVGALKRQLPMGGAGTTRMWGHHSGRVRRADVQTRIRRLGGASDV
jgi:hypothetical protein